MNHPDAFEAFAALSPSIWWNDKVVLKDIPAFEEKVASQGLHPRVFVAAGGLEQKALPGIHLNGIDPAILAREFSYGRITDNARDFVRNLHAKNKGLLILGRTFPGQTHNSVPWTAVNPILDFALPR